MTSFANITSQHYRTPLQRENHNDLNLSDLVTNSMVSPGTHFMNNHEFQSRTSECQFKKQRIRN